MSDKSPAKLRANATLTGAQIAREIALSAGVSAHSLGFPEVMVRLRVSRAPEYRPRAVPGQRVSADGVLLGRVVEVELDRKWMYATIITTSPFTRLLAEAGLIP